MQSILYHSDAKTALTEYEKRHNILKESHKKKHAPKQEGKAGMLIDFCSLYLNRDKLHLNNKTQA